MPSVLAPPAPGALGQRLDPAEVQQYLNALDGWIRHRKDDLDEIDAAALASPTGAQLTADITLSMALWKAVKDRFNLLFAVWDGGRVGPAERERLSALIWGRLDATLDQRVLAKATAANPASVAAAAGGAASGMALALPEACRLSDALAQQLRSRLALDPAADDHARRVKELRISLERLRDQVALEPYASRGRAEAGLKILVERTDDLAAKAQRGGDIGGLLGPLENDAARLERDLIVGGAQRRDAASQVAALAELRRDLEAREAALSALADQTVAAVAPAPRFAVPSVAALGPVPTSPGELAAYGTKLSRVAQAMNLVQERYSGALAERERLAAQLAVAEADAAGAGGEVAAALALARTLLARQPVPVPVVAAQLGVVDAWLALLGRVSPSAAAPAAPIAPSATARKDPR